MAIKNSGAGSTSKGKSYKPGAHDITTSSGKSKVANEDGHRRPEAGQRRQRWLPTQEKLRLGEAPMPSRPQKQQRAMQAAAHGKSHLGHPGESRERVRDGRQGQRLQEPAEWKGSKGKS